ncbi:MAG: hypothetical protein IANPNBLG_01409 [Bryobacteraceae bacterium]|nr:hypothetical protein [Bryobacteraceae bacterium]
MTPRLLAFCLFSTVLAAQEADSGFELRATLSGSVFSSQLLEEAPRGGGPVSAGFRSLLYPTWKLNRNWTFSGAIQVRSRPYFNEEYSTQGYGVKSDVLQAHLSYSRFWKDRSLVFRMGQLSSAFGSFLLRYDDALNPLIDMPPAYGYYYKPVTTLGLPGAQLDVTLGKLDARAQFTASSPANRRGLFDDSQFGSWAGGAGYTLRQGLRVGISAYRGPYLHENYRFYRPGEADPRRLPASGVGIDAQWGHGHWNFNGEWQRFQMDYRAIPTLHQHTGYVEARRVLHPRWYVAVRTSYLRSSAFSGREIVEAAAGYRPNPYQLLKAGYTIQKGPAIRGARANAFTLQLVTSFTPLSWAGR